MAEDVKPVNDFFPDRDYPFRGALEVRHQRFAELRESLLFDLAESVSQATVIAYWADLDSWQWWCLEHDIDPLRPKPGELDSYLDDLRATGYSLNTVARRITALRHFYAHLVAAGELKHSPMSGIHQRRPQPPLAARASKAPRLTARQRRRLLAAAENVQEQVIVGLLGDGVTVTQLSRAAAADVRLGPAVLHSSHRGIPEIVPLSAHTCETVRRHLGRRRAGPLVTDADGRPIDRFYVNRVLARLGRRAGFRTVVDPQRFPQRPSRSPRASSHSSSSD